MLADELLDLQFQSVDGLWCQPRLFIVRVAQRLSQQVFDTAVEQGVEHTDAGTITVSQIVSGKGMDVAYLQLQRNTYLHVKDVCRYLVGREVYASLLIYVSAKGQSNVTVAHQIGRHDWSLRQTGQQPGIIHLAFLLDVLCLVLFLTKDNAAQPVEATAYLTDNA